MLFALYIFVSDIKFSLKKITEKNFAEKFLVLFLNFWHLKKVVRIVGIPYHFFAFYTS